MNEMWSSAKYSSNSSVAFIAILILFGLTVFGLCSCRLRSGANAKTKWKSNLTSDEFESSKSKARARRSEEVRSILANNGEDDEFFDAIGTDHRMEHFHAHEEGHMNMDMDLAACT